MNIAADDKCLVEFENLKYRKIQARYIIYAIEAEHIVIEKIGNKTETWEDFLNALPENRYRYAVFDFEFINQDNMPISKLIFVNWNSDSAPLKQRILYATAKQNFKKYLDLQNKDFTLGSKGDMTFDDMKKEIH